MKDKQRACIVCGDTFGMRGAHPNQKTCSDECSKANRQNIRKRCSDNYRRNHAGAEIKERTRSYRERNKDKLKAINRENYCKRKGTDKYKEYVKKYYEKHKEEINLRARMYYLVNRDKYNKLKRERRRESDYINSDKYFLYSLANNFGVAADEINKDLLEAYKLFLQLKREVRNVKNNSI